MFVSKCLGNIRGILYIKLMRKSWTKCTPFNTHTQKKDFFNNNNKIRLITINSCLITIQ